MRIFQSSSGSSLGWEMSRPAASPDPARGWDEMASILLPFPPSQHKLIRVSQPERKTLPCPPRSRSKRVLPGGLVLPRHGSICWGNAAGKTPQGWKKQKDETGSIQGGDVEDGDSGSAIARNPRGIALVHQTLETGEKIKSS